MHAFCTQTKKFVLAHELYGTRTQEYRILYHLVSEKFLRLLFERRQVLGYRKITRLYNFSLLIKRNASEFKEFQELCENVRNAMKLRNIRMYRNCAIGLIWRHELWWSAQILWCTVTDPILKHLGPIMVEIWSKLKLCRFCIQFLVISFKKEIKKVYIYVGGHSSASVIYMPNLLAIHPNYNNLRSRISLNFFKFLHRLHVQDVWFRTLLEDLP